MKISPVFRDWTIDVGSEEIENHYNNLFLSKNKRFFQSTLYKKKSDLRPKSAKSDQSDSTEGLLMLKSCADLHIMHKANYLREFF